MRGHVLGHYSYVPVRLHPTGLWIEQIRVRFGVVAGKAADACKPWLAEADQDCDPQTAPLAGGQPGGGLMRSHLAQARRRGFRGDVALGRTQHLEPDHEFLDRRGTQERRVEVGVHLPLGMDRAIGGLLVEAH